MILLITSYLNLVFLEKDKPNSPTFWNTLIYKLEWPFFLINLIGKLIHYKISRELIDLQAMLLYLTIMRYYEIFATFLHYSNKISGKSLWFTLVTVRRSSQETHL